MEQQKESRKSLQITAFPIQLRPHPSPAAFSEETPVRMSVKYKQQSYWIRQLPFDTIIMSNALKAHAQIKTKALQCFETFLRQPPSISSATTFFS